MAAALGVAKWLFDKAVEKLSDKLVKDYVSSSELGLDFEKIETDLMYTQELLNEAEERDISNKPGGLQGLLKKLSEKADEAEDALDELHYFIIQDQLDGTQEAAPEVADGASALHGRHVCGSFQLKRLDVDSISAVLVAPICSHLSATLHRLSFYNDRRAKSFTEEQEQALRLLTSLYKLQFGFCKSLQSLPEGLHLLSSLKELTVDHCPEIRSLPREGVPTSLERLSTRDISDDLKVQIKKLKETLPDVHVSITSI